MGANSGSAPSSCFSKFFMQTINDLLTNVKAVEESCMSAISAWNLRVQVCALYHIFLTDCSSFAASTQWMSSGMDDHVILMIKPVLIFFLIATGLILFHQHQYQASIWCPWLFSIATQMAAAYTH